MKQSKRNHKGLVRKAAEWVAGMAIVILVGTLLGILALHSNYAGPETAVSPHALPGSLEITSIK